MVSRFAFSWVQVVLHNQKKLLLVLLVLAGLFLPGLVKIDWETFKIAPYLALALALMSITIIKLMESLKTAVLIFGFSSLSLALLLGLAGGLNWSLQSHSLLGLVIVLIMMMSNIIHVVTALHREMARGNHQFDAIAEALSLNITPILLSNITTILGFGLVAFFDSSYQALALLVFAGFIITLVMLLVLLPMVLLNWHLEFRVGNSEDRHGFLFVADWMIKHPTQTRIVFIILTLLSFGSLSYLFMSVIDIQTILFMLLASFALLAVAWRSISLSLLLVASCLIAIAWSYVLLWPLMQLETLLPLLLVIPFGIILDDGIHFMTRIQRAQKIFPQDAQQTIRFTLSSVGRPIWNTSVVLWVGLMVLVFSGDLMTQQAALMIMAGVLAVTLMMLILLPAFYVRNI